MSRFGLKPFVLLFFLCLAVAPNAWAEEEPPVIKALYDTLAELSGERPTHQSLAVAGDGTITLTGSKILLQNFQQDGQDIRQEMNSEQMVFGDIKELSAGLYEVGTMKVKGAVLSVSTPELEDFRATMPVMEGTGVFIRSPSLLKTSIDRVFAQSMLARTYTIPLVTFSGGDFSLDLHDVKMTWNGDPRTFMGEGSYSVGSIEIPADTLNDLGMKPSLKDLGYDGIIIGLTARGNMQMPKEHLEIDGDSSILARDMGAFTTSGAVGGIQPALLEAAQTMQESPTTIDINAMMAMLQSITISHIKLRYDDASLAERLLKHIENTEGKSREQIVTESTAMSDFGLAGVGSPELAAQAKVALQVFLSSPGWIEFELKPDAPIPVSQLMPMIGTPAEVVKLLKIQIRAGARQ